LVQAAAFHDLLAQAPTLAVKMGPLEDSLAIEDEGPLQIVHELHDVRAEHLDLAVAVPAREATVGGPVAVAFAGQPGAAAVAPAGATIDADRQATALNLLLLAPPGTRPGGWRWGASADWLGAVAADVDMPPGEAVRPAVVVLPAEQTGEATEGALAEDAGLAAGSLPADTTALAQAVRRFLAGLDVVGRELTRALSQNAGARWVVIAVAAVLAAEAVRRRTRRAARRGAAAEEDESATLSWLAGSYPFRPEDV
jgi:hypothetical protein